jgi:uncharacterized protein YyaL (SSP411 family)
MVEIVQRSFLPNGILVLKTEGSESLVSLAPYLDPMVPVGGKATAYICENYACMKPVTDPAELEDSLR